MSLLKLTDILNTAAARLPGKTAVVDGTLRFSYGDIALRADALAGTLVDAGVRPGDRVLLLMANGAPAVIAFWAVLKAGAVVCPMHPGTLAGKLAYCLHDTGATALLADEGLREVALGAAARSPNLVMTLIGQDLERAGRRAGVPPTIDPAASDLAAILYTSGSTGVPKGVVLGHDNMRAAVQAISAYLAYREDDVVLAALPMSFDYGLYQMLLAFAAGARLVLEPSFTLLARVLARMEREGVTVLPGMPTVFALLARMDAMQALHRHRLDAVRMVTSTGARLAASQIDWLRLNFPAAQIFSMYGLTECKRCSYLPPQDLQRKPGSVGIAMPGLRFWVVDDAGRRLPPGQLGELVVQGPTVMRGYWGDARATALRLRATQEGVALHTGDLCCIDDEGYLTVVRRMDDMIKSRGERVSPREIEDALLAVAGIRQAAVVGVPDEVQGQALKAVLVVDAQALLDEDGVRQALRGRLEQRLMPTHIEFRTALPLGPTGKIDHAALR